eukprot:m.105597 g.105597  ORF g.105597 m.105597 type:complete len:425 (-) comp9134_c3_seq1:351-1625(-)
MAMTAVIGMNGADVAVLVIVILVILFPLPSAARMTRSDYFPRLDSFPVFDARLADPPCGMDCKMYQLKQLEKQLTSVPPSSSSSSGWMLAKDIASRSELFDNVGPFISPILYGGLGNELFQLAALHVYGRAFNVPVVSGYFKHWNKMYPGFRPWGGHPYPMNNSSITLKTVFPSLQWVGIDDLPIDSNRVFNPYAFKISKPDDYFRLPKTDMLPAFIHGYFFNHKYWHHERHYLLKLFRFHPAIDEYLHSVYGSFFEAEQRGELDTVSIHMRLGYSGEPASPLVNAREFPSAPYFYRAFKSKFGTSTPKHFLVFTDNPSKVWDFMHAMEKKWAESESSVDLKYTVVEENVVNTLALMRMCKHHVLTSSTLSFWGSYLNEKQNGYTIVPSSFFKQHGADMIPKDFFDSNKWVVWKADSTDHSISV